jgi:hypothetical protein
LKTDVVTHKELIRDSENKRYELQVHITSTSVKIREDTDEHRQYQDQLIAETDSLRQEIQSLRQYQARREQEFLHTVEDLNLTHKSKVDNLTRDHYEKLTALSNES